MADAVLNTSLPHRHCHEELAAGEWRCEAAVLELVLHTLPGS